LIRRQEPILDRGLFINRPGRCLPPRAVVILCDAPAVKIVTPNAVERATLGNRDTTTDHAGVHRELTPQKVIDQFGLLDN